MKCVKTDGGREAAGFKGLTRDCVVRAIAVATGKLYAEVYADLAKIAKAKKCKSPRLGVERKVYEPYLLSLGWKWTPTMKVGQGTTVHLRESELPTGRLVVVVSKHLAAVIDGVLHDNHDSSRDDSRCVYGYYQGPVTPVVKVEPVRELPPTRVRVNRLPSKLLT